MVAVGIPSQVFLVCLFIVLPWMAFRSARRLHALHSVRGDGGAIPRESVWLGTLVMQALLLALAWATARSYGSDIFEVPLVGLRELLIGAGALAACVAVRALLHAVRSEEERRALAVYAIAPRTAREWGLWTATVLVASVAEEAAYRGVGVAILWYWLGSPTVAVLLCATAFTLGHWVQGAKSGVAIFFIALVMHGVVRLTGTLFIAIAVHAIYDFIAGYLIARDAPDIAA